VPSGDLQQMLDERYNDLLRKLLGPIDEEIARQEMAELLKMWNPNDPMN
jgi:hypothetical protein